MSVFLDSQLDPIEIGPGRGDLRYHSTWFEQTIRQGPRSIQRIGKAPVSFSHLFATQPWVAAAVMRMLTWSVRVPLKAYRRKEGGDSRQQLEASEHPIARMLTRPWLGPMSNRARLVQVLLGPLLVHGNSVIEVETIGGEEYLKAMDWRGLTPLGTASGQEINGWRYDEQNNGEYRDIGVDRALHCAWWSPLGPLGVSPLEQLGVTIQVEDAANRFQRAMLGNSARPPSAVTSDTEFLNLKREERTALMSQLRADVEELYSGPENAGKPAILPPGLDWKPIGHTSSEAQLVEQRKVAREEVAAVYQIPPPMIGILDHATYSNIEVMREMAYTMALGPPLAIIEQTLTSTLARDFFGEDDLYVEFDFGPVLRGDRQKEIGTFRDAINNGIQTMNEARRALNLPPSTEPDADRLFYPANNLKPVGDAEAEAAKAAAAEATPSPALPGGVESFDLDEDEVLAVIDRTGRRHDAKGRFAKKSAPKLRYGVVQPGPQGSGAEWGPPETTLGREERLECLEVLSQYGGDWNDALRHDPDRWRHEAATARMDRMVESGRVLKKGSSLWRGVSRRDDFDPRDLEPGDEISDRGYTSLTEDRRLASEFSESSLAHGGSPGVLLRVHVVEDQPAADVMDAVEYANEEFGNDEPGWSELVCGRDCRMVVRSRDDEGEVPVLDVDLYRADPEPIDWTKAATYDYRYYPPPPAPRFSSPLDPEGKETEEARQRLPENERTN